MLSGIDSFSLGRPAKECGIYTVASLNLAQTQASLIRAPDWAANGAIPNGVVVNVSEGTIWPGSSWRAMVTGAKTINVNDPLFYPQKCKGIVTLAAGVFTLGAAQGLALFSTSKSIVQVTTNVLNSAGSTVDYNVPGGNRVAGKVGTASVKIQAMTSAGVVDTANVSVLDWYVVNW